MSGDRAECNPGDIRTHDYVARNTAESAVCSRCGDIQRTTLLITSGITFHVEGAKQYTMKDDSGKAPVHLVPPEVIYSVASVLAFGATKYEANSWRAPGREAVPHTRNLSSAMRHLYEYQMGQDMDPESGLHVIDHAICQLIFLRYNILKGKGEDDRFIEEDGQ